MSLQLQIKSQMKGKQRECGLYRKINTEQNPVYIQRVSTVIQTNGSNEILCM